MVCILIKNITTLVMIILKLSQKYGELCTILNTTQKMRQNIISFFFTHLNRSLNSFNDIKNPSRTNSCQTILQKQTTAISISVVQSYKDLKTIFILSKIMEIGQDSPVFICKIYRLNFLYISSLSKWY